MAFSLAVGSSFLSHEHPAEYVRGFPASLQVLLSTPLFSLVFCPMNCSSSHLSSVSSTQGTIASCLTFSSLCHGLETLSRQYSGATVGLTSVVLISRDHSHSSLVDGVLKTAVSSNLSGAFCDCFRWKGKSGLCHSVWARSRNPGNMIFRGCIHYTDVPKN